MTRLPPSTTRPPFQIIPAATRIQGVLVCNPQVWLISVSRYSYARWASNPHPTITSDKFLRLASLPVPPQAHFKTKAKCPYYCLTSLDYRVRSIYTEVLGLVIFVIHYRFSNSLLLSQEPSRNNLAHREDVFNLQPARVRRPINLLWFVPRAGVEPACPCGR